ncbi:MAG: TatD family hydrolase, partial [Kiritimatiellaeota bacterium]|nr:TatD family hydrolase [Kiritimatiellota bacterium]
AIIGRAVEAGVTRILAVGGSPGLHDGALRAQAAAPENVVIALGLDRDQTGLSKEQISSFILHLSSLNPRALGEVGLDYHHAPHTRPAQVKLFSEMAALGRERGLPLVIHTREADDDTLGVIDEVFQKSPARGVVHCFTGDIPFARKCLDRGLHISLSGIVTFRNADALRDVAAYVPLDRLLIETDSPFLAPVPLRVNPNEPAFLPHVAECVARCRKIPVDVLADATRANTELLLARP